MLLVDLILSDVVITHLLSFRFSRPSYSNQDERNLVIGKIVAHILTKTNLVLLSLLDVIEDKKNRSFTRKRLTDDRLVNRVNIQIIICSYCLGFLTINCNWSIKHRCIHEDKNDTWDYRTGILTLTPSVKRTTLSRLPVSIYKPIQEPTLLSS